MWRKLIAGCFSSAGFSTGCSDDALDAVERALGVGLPSDLRAALGESDGVSGEHELALLWPLARIREDNLLFRSNADFQDLYMPFEHLLFFADAGNGDQFAFAIQGTAVRRPDIFAWNHENDSRTWVAPSLERYFDWWLSGRIVL